MGVVVDRGLCEANEVCVRTCPEVFRGDDDERLTIRIDPIPDHLRPAAEKSVGSCPRQALALED